MKMPRRWRGMEESVKRADKPDSVHAVARM